MYSQHYGKYTFLSTEKDPGDREFQGNFLFNTSKFLKSRTVPGKLVSFLLHSNVNQIKAGLWVTLVGDKGLSPWKAPFGSIECPEMSIDPGILEEFVSWILGRLTAMGINTLRIVSYPDFYNPEGKKKIEKALLSCGFVKGKDEINQHIRVLSGVFMDQISHAEKKRLKKCIRSGFKSARVSAESLPEAYELLVNSRQRKGYPVTMSYDDLNEMFTVHPDNYLLFIVRDGKKMIAMAVSIRVSEKVIYNFYHADHQDYQKFSPTVMVVDTVYGFCRNNDVEFIDLGISSSEGILNEGIYKFKKGLGAMEGSKSNYLWTA